MARTVTCNKITIDDKGGVELTYSDTNGTELGLSFPSDAAFVDWLEGVEAALPAEFLVAMAILPEYRAGKLPGQDAAYDGVKIALSLDSAEPAMVTDAVKV